MLELMHRMLERILVKYELLEHIRYQEHQYALSDPLALIRLQDQAVEHNVLLVLIHLLDQAVEQTEMLAQSHLLQDPQAVLIVQ